MLGGQILMFDGVSGIVGTYEGIPIEIFDLPKENQVWVIKINVDKYGFDGANDIFMSIKNQYPDVPMFGVTSDVDICSVDIDFLISELEKMRYKK
jgi:hypothetical protein